jgi:hypothetical protein
MSWVQTCLYIQHNTQDSQANYPVFHVYNLPENTNRNSNFGIKINITNTETFFIKFNSKHYNNRKKYRLT